ncbi:MAG: hypothetical protein LUE88_01570 [Clostridiales bacterium]|nr:hypothetical protein [Clostridiales bacterium]
MAKHKCPVCGQYEFPEEGSYDICEVCGAGKMIHCKKMSLTMQAVQTV